MEDSEAFQGRLLPGEHLVWTGRPQTGVIFPPRDMFLIPLSLFWGGFAVFWFGAALTGAFVARDQANTDLPFVFPLFGAPFVLIGLFMIFGRFALDAWFRTRTTYGLTETRALITRTGPWPKFTAVQLNRALDCEIREGKDGRATIFLGSRSGMFDSRAMGFGFWIPSLDPTPQFLRISDGHSVFSRIQLAIAGH